MGPEAGTVGDRKKHLSTLLRSEVGHGIAFRFEGIWKMETGWTTDRHSRFGDHARVQR